MALPVRAQLKYWGIAAIAFAVVLWFLGDVLLPFVLGGAIAYFLDPVADRLERAGMSRAMATGTITIMAVTAMMMVPVAMTRSDAAADLGSGGEMSLMIEPEIDERVEAINA